MPNQTTIGEGIFRIAVILWQVKHLISQYTISLVLPLV